MESYKKINLARQFRREPTPEEEILWQLLRNKKLSGYKFRRQHVLNGYILDFYCPRKRFCIELDGQQHYTTEGKEYDSDREKNLKESKVDFLRFPNHELENPDYVLERILKKLQSLTEFYDK